MKTTNLVRLGLLFGAIALGISAWADEPVEYLDGGYVAMGTMTFEVYDLVYDPNDHSITGSADYTDTAGLTSIVNSSFKVLTMDEDTWEISETTMQATPSVSSDTATWDFDFSIPQGEVFYGCDVSGTYSDGTTNHALGAQVSGRAEY